MRGEVKDLEWVLLQHDNHERLMSLHEREIPRRFASFSELAKHVTYCQPLDGEWIWLKDERKGGFGVLFFTGPSWLAGHLPNPFRFPPISLSIDFASLPYKMYPSRCSLPFGEYQSAIMVTSKGYDARFVVGLRCSSQTTLT
jgi:hypothetical protein